MKKIFAVLILRVLFFMPGETKAEANFSGGFDVFYSSLSPHGEWVSARFGQAWRPFHVGHEWRPYLYGRWVWTDYGWYWVSEEPYGWATYHYGRWYYDDYYGWIWVPGETWGPAWVEWRYSDNYIGWAPLSPYAEFRVDVGVTYRNHWVTPVHYWNFVASEHFTSARAVEHIQPAQQARRIFGSTRGAESIRSDGGRIVNRGIDINFVERRGNMRVNRVDVVPNDRGSGERLVREANRDRIEVSRPKVERRTENNTARPPARARQPERLKNQPRQVQPYGRNQWDMQKGNFRQEPPQNRVQQPRTHAQPQQKNSVRQNPQRQRNPERSKNPPRQDSSPGRRQ